MRILISPNLRKWNKRKEFYYFILLINNDFARHFEYHFLSRGCIVRFQTPPLSKWAILLKARNNNRFFHAPLRQSLCPPKYSVTNLA